MSDSSLSDLSDFDFTSSTPHHPDKHSLSPSSSSVRPSKKIKLVYNRQLSEASKVQNLQNQQHRTMGSVPPDKMIISKIEVQQLRENNGFLRKSNVELAKAHAHAVGQGRAAAAQIKRAKTEADEAQLEIERLKRRIDLLAVLTNKDSKIDAATVSKKMEQLEEYRKVYWECGVEWARKEGAWNVERQLFKKEVEDLVEKIEVLEGEVAEERAKVRGFEGGMLEMQRGRSLGRIGTGEGNGMMDSRQGDSMMVVHGVESQHMGMGWQMQCPEHEQFPTQGQDHHQQQVQDMWAMQQGEGVMQNQMQPGQFDGLIQGHEALIMDMGSDDNQQWKMTDLQTSMMEELEMDNNNNPETGKLPWSRRWKVHRVKKKREK